MNDGIQGSDSDSDPFNALLARAARITPISGRSSLSQIHPGVTLVDGRFQVLSRLGKGGMGVVFEAFDRHRGVTVALKTLSDLDATGIYRLKHEFRSLAGIVHPNLVRLHELFNDGELWLFSMERVRGELFDAWVRPAGRPDVERVRRGFEQLLAGVEAIHGAGKLHRDLKPRNVLVEHGSERVVILDFGLATDQRDATRAQSMDTAISGTPLYMAPEQAAGFAASAESDLYAVGVMLFEALTGVAPFEAGPMAVLSMKQAQVAPRARDLEAPTPEDLDRLCAQLLERDPVSRPGLSAARAMLGAPSPVVAAGDAAARSVMPLVGREDVLARLDSAFEAALAGAPTLVSICGESGIGKTALATTFLQGMRSSGRAMVLEGRCYERESVPYKAWDRLVDDLTHQLRQRSHAEVAAVLPREAAELRRLFPVFSRLDAVASAVSRPVSDEAESLRRARAAFSELLGRLRMRAPLVLFVDDVQWLDSDSVALFEQLLLDPDPPALLLIVAHGSQASQVEPTPLLDRVLAAARANRRVVCHSLELGALAPEAVRAMTARALAVGTDPAGVESRAERIVREAAGNPFFVAELTRTVSVGASPRVGGELSLEQAIVQRLHGLGDAATRVMSALALAGRPTPIAVLTESLGGDADAHRELDRLCHARLARELPELRYACYHDRVRAAVIDSLPLQDQRALHLALAVAWEQQPDVPAAEVFEHLFAAGEHTAAGAWALRAAEHAGAVLAFEQCAAFLAHAIELLPAERASSLELHLRRAEALSYSGRWALAAAAFREASLHCAEPLARQHMLLKSATHALASGQAELGLPLLRGVCEQAGARWPRTAVGAMFGAALRFTWLWLTAGHSRLPANGDERVAGSFERDVERLLLEHWLSNAGLVPAYDLARGLYFMGVFSMAALRSSSLAIVGLGLGVVSMMLSASRLTIGRAKRLGERSLVVARGHGNAALASASLAFVAYAHWLRGESRAAYEIGTEAARILDASPIAHPYNTWIVRTLRAYTLLTMGRLPEAMVLFEENERVTRQSQDELGFIGGTSVLRWLVRGDLEQAWALVEHKERLLERSQVRGALWELTRVERVLCAMYAGRGADVVREDTRVSSLLPWFDPDVPTACAALQADPDGRNPGTRKLVQRSAAMVRARGGSAANEAIACQLSAAVARLDGRGAEAIQLVQRAADRYTAAGMDLHAALMRLRWSQLEPAQAGLGIEARAFIQSLGVVDVDAWAEMLAPGLSS